MLFQKIVKNNPERAHIIVEAGEALLDGRPVCLHFTGTNDGRRGFLANADADATAVIGLADEAIASGKYGKVLAYGLKTNAQVINASDLAAGGVGGHFMIMSASSGHLALSVSIGEETNFQPNIIAANSASKTVSATLYAASVFVRML